MSISTLATLPDNGGVLSSANVAAINAAITAQNANNTSISTGSGLVLTSATGLPGSTGLVANSVGSAQLDPTTIQYVSGTIANAAVLTLFSSPVAIIAAQGAGTLIEVVSMVLENVFLTAAYAAGGAIQLSYGAGVTTAASATIAATFLTSPVANQSILVAGALASSLSSAVLNTAINLAAATANFTTGAGSLKYRVAYRVHTGL
jgi:hypothetical protein